jgi:cytosine/uracil/thiamine/allantoin permease
MSHLTHTAGGFARRTEENTAVQWLGRFGDVCYGIVHIVVAVLAVRLAFGQGGHELDQRGAIAIIAAQPFGTALLWLIAIGLIAFGVWQLLAAAVSFGWVRGRGRRVRRRIGVAARGVAVLVIASFTVRLLVSDPTSAANSTQREWTARLLALPGGRALVGLVGAAVVVAAVVIARRGVKRQFLEDWNLGALPAKARRWAVRMGVIGLPAKAVSFAVIGILLAVAAIRLDPNEAGGLDAALRVLAAQPFGALLLVVVALGFVAYGGYCFAEARCRRG